MITKLTLAVLAVLLSGAGGYWASATSAKADRLMFPEFHLECAPYRACQDV